MGSGYPVDITSTFPTAFFTFSHPTSTSTFASAPDAPSASIHPPPPPIPPRPAYLPPSAPWPTPPLVPIPNHPLPPPPRPLPRAFHSTGIIHPPPPSASHPSPSPPKKKKRERAKRAPPCLASILPAHAPPPVEPLFTRKPLEFSTLTSPVKPRPPSNAVPPPALTYSHRPPPTTQVTATTSHSQTPAYFVPLAPPHPYPPIKHVPPAVSLNTAATFDFGILDTLPSWVTSMGSVTEDEGVLKEVDNVVDDIGESPLWVSPKGTDTHQSTSLHRSPRSPSLWPWIPPPSPLPLTTSSLGFPPPQALGPGSPLSSLISSLRSHCSKSQLYPLPTILPHLRWSRRQRSRGTCRRTRDRNLQKSSCLVQVSDTLSHFSLSTLSLMFLEDLGIVGSQMPTERPRMEAQEAASTDGGKG